MPAGAPINITLQLDKASLDQLVQKLGSATAASTLAAPMQRAVDRIQRSLQRYPPTPPGSTYTRTGDLGSAWKTNVSTSSSGVAGTVSNGVVSPMGTHYGPFVQGTEKQTKAHARTGWLTDEEGLAENIDGVYADFEATVKDALSK